MDMLKVAQALRPDLNIIKVEGHTDFLDGMKQWWLFSPNAERPGKNKCIGNIIAESYYKEDEVSECVMHKLDISLTVFE